MQLDERCARCGHPLQEDEVRPGVSRLGTERVCAWCSEHEGMQQAFEPHELTPREEWWDRYTGGPVDDYRLVLVAKGTEADRVTLELWTLTEQARAALYRRRHDIG